MSSHHRNYEPLERWHAAIFKRYISCPFFDVWLVHLLVIPLIQRISWRGSRSVKLPVADIIFNWKYLKVFSQFRCRYYTYRQSLVCQVNLLQILHLFLWFLTSIISRWTIHKKSIPILRLMASHLWFKCAVLIEGEPTLQAFLWSLRDSGHKFQELVKHVTDVLHSLKTMSVIWTGLFRFKPVF